MIERPAYFEAIREKASKQWDILDADPGLAGPWHQLFKQIQSPRHVVSELLQNADDAGATIVSVAMEFSDFVFRHNGEDFTEEHFGSLCRFGYSNKRALHTIGFRGIGFKSIFSLGDMVQLLTPTLSVFFEKKHFTEPQWNNHIHTPSSVTEIRVHILDKNRLRELQANLDEWSGNSVTLFFFRSIKSLTIGDKKIQCTDRCDGPAKDSERYTRHDGKGDYIVFHSPPENFPEEALQEIKSERLVDSGKDLGFPPCKVELVLGTEGRLFVVLPTKVITRLPFACNAPFIQDPARIKIKDPSISPTNRWLLKRVGKLAAIVMLEWLGNESLSLEERAKAYSLLPAAVPKGSELEEECHSFVVDSFRETIADNPMLLTSEGRLVPALAAIAIPVQLVAVWPEADAASLLDSSHRPAISRYIHEEHRGRLVGHGWLGELKKIQVVRTLMETRPPKPKGWAGLLNLWSYIAKDVFSLGSHFAFKKLNILPVRGQPLLCAGTEVLRIGEHRLLQSEEDWSFLESYVTVLDSDWVGFLSDRISEGKESTNKLVLSLTADLEHFLKLLGIDSINDSSTVFKHITHRFFKKPEIVISEAIRLTQIGAKLAAKAGDEFRYLTNDGMTHLLSEDLLRSESSAIADLLPEEWYNKHVISSSYTQAFSACSKNEWDVWLSSGNAGLHNFPLLSLCEIPISYGSAKKKIEEIIHSRGYDDEFEYPFSPNSYVIEDWNYPEIFWQHWKQQAEKDPAIWARLIELILGMPTEYWTTALTARAFQIASTGTRKQITSKGFLPAWINALRNLPCLTDTHGRARIPRDLLRRTSATEGHLDVEAFVHSRLDREAVRPLLDALGVGSVAVGPDRLLACLRALSLAPIPPVEEVDKWYRRLDLVAGECPTDGVEKIRSVLYSEKLILSEDGQWTAPPWVFVSANEDDAPGAPLVRKSVRDLSLWHRIGIADRPTINYALDWLRSLQASVALSEQDLGRVKAILSRHGFFIIKECKRALNLLGEWVVIDSLRFSFTLFSSIPYSHLYDSIKRKTADLRDLHTDSEDSSVQLDLIPLSEAIENRIIFPMGLPEKDGQPPVWMACIAILLSRACIEDQKRQAEIRVLANDLAATRVRHVSGLKSIPYIDGTPAGTAKVMELLWQDRMLYLDSSDRAKLAKLIPRELGKRFMNQDIADALCYCYERPENNILAYMESNFSLDSFDLAADVAETPLSGSTERESRSQGPATGEGAEPKESLEIGPSGSAAIDELNYRDQDREDASETVNEDFEDEGEERKPRAERKQRTPLIERFALERGFLRESEQRFSRHDGSWIAKSYESVFPWIHYGPAGEVVRYYSLKECCLETEPIEVEAEVWNLIEQNPQSYSLILTSSTEKPIEYEGCSLLKLREQGYLTLFPASYRLLKTDA